MTAPKNPSADWLRAHGYDGLYLPGECACLIDDLRPCGELDQACKPGYRVEPDEEWREMGCAWCVEGKRP